jgi:hypothetical protein
MRIFRKPSDDEDENHDESTAYGRSGIYEKKVPALEKNPGEEDFAGSFSGEEKYRRLLEN